jgi:hypothetical protein
MLTLARDYEGLNVALIGVGSSAIQILPHLQKKCKDVHLFARGGTWISEPFGGSATQETISGDKDSGNCTWPLFSILPSSLTKARQVYRKRTQTLP